MKQFLLCALAGTALTASAIAIPSPEAAETRTVAFDYRREFIPAEATLVAHLDITSFNASTFGKLFAENRDDLNIEELDDLQKDLGFDPFQVLRSITAFGAGASPQPNTAVVIASSAIDEALLKLQQDEKFELSVHEGIEVFEYDGTFGYVREVFLDDLPVREAIGDHPRLSRTTAG